MTEHRPLNTAHLPLKLRVEDYLALDRTGAFEAYRKTELLDGRVLYMNAQHRPHARVKSRLHLALAAALARIDGPLEAMVEVSIAIPPHDVPEPDIVVTGEASGEGLLPVAAAALVIEVSDSTLDTDLGAKAALFSAAGIPEYWVADVNGRTIHQLWSPGEAGYAERRTLAFGEAVEAATIMGLRVETEKL